MRDALLWYLLAINLVAFVAFGYDKLRAVRGGSRVSEKSLLWLAFLLGAPGAWLGTKAFRHKTVKRSFRLKLWTVTVLELFLVGAVLWWLYGSEWTGV